MNDHGQVVGKYTFLCSGTYAVLWHSTGGIEKLFPYADDDAFAPLTYMVNDPNRVACIEEKRRTRPVGVNPNDSLERRYHLWDRARGKISFDGYLPADTREFTVRDLNNQGCILGVAHLRAPYRDVPMLLEPVFAKNESRPEDQTPELMLAGGL